MLFYSKIFLQIIGHLQYCAEYYSYGYSEERYNLPCELMLPLARSLPRPHLQRPEPIPGVSLGHHQLRDNRTRPVTALQLQGSFQGRIDTVFLGTYM